MDIQTLIALFIAGLAAAYVARTAWGRLLSIAGGNSCEGCHRCDQVVTGRQLIELPRAIPRSNSLPGGR
jgi:hypothetical protein